MPSPSASADLTLPAVLDMRKARDLKRILEAAIDRGETPLIDASQVARISTGCVQIVVSFVSTMQQLGRQVTIRHPSDAMVHCFSDLGVSETLDACKSE